MVMAAKSVTNGGHHPTSHTARYPHSPLESTMHRTFYPKYANYMGDGSGRDSYVVLNNGGLANSDKRYMMWRPNKLPKKVDPKPYKQAASLQYKSDGSGRDSYVLSHSGGLKGDYRCHQPQVIFERGLRQHYLSPLRNRNDRSRGPDGTDYLNWMTPRDQAQIRKTAVRQKEVTERLSPPKMHHKFQNFAVTDGFTANGFKAPQARNLSRFERKQIEDLEGQRRLGVHKRRSEQVGGFGMAGAQTLQKMNAHRKPFDIDAEDVEMPLAGGKKRERSLIGTGLQTDMMIQEHFEDPTRNAFSSAVSPALSPMRGSIERDQAAYRTAAINANRRATTQIDGPQPQGSLMEMIERYNSSSAMKAD